VSVEDGKRASAAPVQTSCTSAPDDTDALVAVLSDLQLEAPSSTPKPTPISASQPEAPPLTPKAVPISSTVVLFRGLSPLKENLFTTTESWHSQVSHFVLWTSGGFLECAKDLRRIIQDSWSSWVDTRPELYISITGAERSAGPQKFVAQRFKNTMESFLVEFGFAFLTQMMEEYGKILDLTTQAKISVLLENVPLVKSVNTAPKKALVVQYFAEFVDPIIEYTLAEVELDDWLSVLRADNWWIYFNFLMATTSVRKMADVHATSAKTSTIFKKAKSLQFVKGARHQVLAFESDILLDMSTQGIAKGARIPQEAEVVIVGAADLSRFATTMATTNDDDDDDDDDDDNDGKGKLKL
jgi:hypothetical protein